MYVICLHSIFMIISIRDIIQLETNWQIYESIIFQKQNIVEIFLFSEIF